MNWVAGLFLQPWNPCLSWLLGKREEGERRDTELAVQRTKFRPLRFV